MRIYEGHCREMEEYTMEPAEMPLHRMWSAEEGDYNLGLDKYGVVLNMEADRTTTFKCYEEDWEKEARTRSTRSSPTTSSGRIKLARTPRRRATW